mmetsp:Transcript_38540/g.58666  ORF Transcript_38540/g.58666 Transcript_38540/m.58666 type:complete len:146 (-) Transcript_38540:54-491(-)
MHRSTMRSIQRPTQDLNNLVKNSLAHPEADPALRFSSYKIKADQGDYKSMNACYYYSSTLIMFGLAVGLAIPLNDVTVVFDFISAICVSALGMFFPALFFLKAYKRLSEGEREGLGGYKCLAYFNFCLGLVAFATGIMSNVVSII